MLLDADTIQSDRQTLATTHFWRNVDTAVRLLKQQDKMETTTMYKLFLDVKREGKLLNEIRGILDELSIMLHIQEQQKRVLRGLTKHITRLLSASKSTTDGNSFSKVGSRRGSFAGLADLRALGPQTPGAVLGSHVRFDDVFLDSVAPSVDPAKITMIHARELAENLDERDGDLTGLEETARQIYDSLNRLVDLKLQQASVIQAQEASEEALKQGRSIMLFTVITIIFLPLSFVASVFQMSSASTDYPNGLVTFREQFLYMVPTSLAFASFVLVISLSDTMRGMIIYFFQLPWTWISTQLNLDVLWRALLPDGRKWTAKTKKKISDLKASTNLARHRKLGLRTDRATRLQRQAIETLTESGTTIRTEGNGKTDNGHENGNGDWHGKKGKNVVFEEV